MVVQHNISGMNSKRQLNITTGVQAKSSEKLSSGYRINRAADDAAGLAISEKMRRQIRGLTQASSNAQDGISWCQIADGALEEVSEMLGRAKTLAVQAANDTLQSTDRNYINEEMQKIAAEIDRIHASTEFNNINIFSNDGYEPNENISVTETDGKLMVNIPGGKSIEISVNFIGDDGKEDSVKESSAAGNDTSYASSDFAKFIQSAAANAVSKLASKYDRLFSAASSDDIKIGLNLTNVDGAGGTLAVASLKMSWTSDYSMMSYSLKVDTSDYNESNFASMTPQQKSDLASVIAHEMTHLVMYDTLTDGMLNGFPKWFIEGMAQTSSGDNGWVSNSIGPSSSDAAVKDYMSQMTSMPYGAGYLATMYLGYAVSSKAGNTAVTSDNILNGLESLMVDMATNKHTLDEAIASLTNYTGQAAFTSGFRNADSNAFSFVRNLLNERGTTGAGSLLGSLGASEHDVFKNASSGGSNSSYNVDTSNTWFTNAYGTGYTLPEKGSITDDSLGKMLYLQVGSETSSQNQIGVKRYNVTLNSLTEGNTFDTTTRENALETIETVNIAGQNVAHVRSYYGALQNRLEHTIKNLDNVVENTQSAESLIRDTDMAAEMVKYSNNNILAQAGQAMLAQANQSNQGVLSLLQ